jgi:hypothetical protein
MEMEIDPDYIARFKADLLLLSPDDVFSRYILPAPCKGASDIDERALRERIAKNFAIDVERVIIVGSAKLGFTLRHKRAFDRRNERPPFSPFCQNSDVDVAIVSDALFDSIWKKCFEFWHGSGYGNATNYWPGGAHFRDYIFRGWMRPDHLPSEGDFTYKTEWFDFFRRLTSDRAAGDYKVTAGLYRELYFLKMYQTVKINERRVAMSAAI